MKIARSFQRREGRIEEDLNRLRHQLEATAITQPPPTPPGSPIILSLAKQIAIIVQTSNGDLPELGTEMLLQRCISDSPSSRSNEGRAVIGRHGGDGVASFNCVTSAPRNVTSFVGVENVSTPPIWDETSESSISSELMTTYKYPRILRNDPTLPLTGDCQRLRLIQRMETTLKHVQGNYWKVPVNPIINGFDSISNIGYTTSTVLGEVCDGQHQRRQVQPSELMLANGSKPKSKKGSTHHASRGASTPTPGTSFQPSATPENAWSEPSASTMHVRGRTYANDGVKVESEASIFSVIGVDSFVSGDKGEVADASARTRSYLSTWKGVCEELGYSNPPFLLIFNFIVPWGSFQTYLVRPDADEGPFCSRHRNRPSEKAWRKFMDGSTEYRNERLKLIPRVCAGPWVVKKVVGSTPALIGTKLPVSYRGSVSDNYLEIILDVTKGPALGNSVANTVVGKADAVTVDLGFVIEGKGEDGHLPEQMLGLIRFHHLNMAKAPTRSQWNQHVL